MAALVVAAMTPSYAADKDVDGLNKLALGLDPRVRP
jgi:hypothetical protein